MSPKNSVAAERRMDLASLFCLIGRHGPAVAVAVVALVSVLAGFIIYRSVSGKRRKAAAADRDGRDGPGPGDASVIRASLEGSRSSAESTDMSDEGSSEVKEDVDLIQSDLKIRHRRAAAAEKEPPPYSPSKSDIQVPANKHTTPDDTTEVTAVVWGSHKEAEAHAEDASQGLQSDTCAVAEDAAECRRGATDDTTEDVIEEFHDNDGRLKEPELSDDEEHEEEEEGVLKAECQEDEDPVCFEHTPDMGEKGDDDRLQDNKTTLETNGIEYNYKEPLIDTKDVPVPCISCGKNEEFEEENPDSVDCSSYSGNNCLSPEEEKKNEGEEAEEECVDYGQQAEIWSSTFKQETNLPSIQQDQWYIEDGGLAGEVIEEVIDEDNLNELTAVKFDAHSPQFNEQEVEIKQKEENGLLCNQEDGADQVEEKMLTSDNTVASSDERNRSNVANSAALPCLSASVKVDYHDDRPPGVTTDAKTPISGIADFPDLSLDCQQPQKEDKIAPSLDEDTDSTILGPEMPSHETEIRPENNENGTTMVLAEERNDQAYDPHVQSSYKDQKSIQMINYEAFDKASDATAPDIVACEGDTTADPDTIENITASLIVEEISCPHLPSICQDQESNHRENNETFDETGVNSATDTPACDSAIPMMSVELSCPDMLSSSHDQHSDQTVEVNTGAAPEDIMPPVYQIHLPSFEQIELRINDMSFSSVGEESGISSMAVSPDLQDAGNEFDVAIENMVLPVMDCDLQSEGQTEAENSLFADDVAMSVINEDTAGTVFEPYPSRRSQPPHPDGTNSFAANEDMFGHEIENRYHRAIDQFIAQISASTTNFTDELKKQTNMKAVVEVVEIQKKEAGVSVEKKKETKAEEKEEDYEKTEISIMEATMDNNEWITDSNYQVLPWMNLSATSFAQDHTKTNQPPTEECQYSPAITDTTCIDTTDIPPPTEAKQTSSLSSGDENTESNKKIVAVQPMPQNVNVTFRVHYFTQSPYQTVAVTGNQQELGNWKGFIPLERAKDGQWATVVSLPAESHVEWKFVVVDKGEVCRWEECGNRLLDTGYGDDLLVHKWWGFL